MFKRLYYRLIRDMAATKILAAAISDNSALLYDKDHRKKAVVNSLVLANSLVKDIKACDHLSNVSDNTTLP